ncbi:MAG TPA: hypothetical protein EYG24_00955 [Methylococcales bacterium]|nr:hypothetical protein [Methylococcales bacterium]
MSQFTIAPAADFNHKKPCFSRFLIHAPVSRDFTTRYLNKAMTVHIRSCRLNSLYPSKLL